MKNLAQEAGVSQSTVSLALRNDPRISPATRSLVQRLAKKRAYVPDPALSALVAYRARTRPPQDYGKIALLHDFDRQEKDFPFAFRQQVEGVRDQARRFGYEIELFRVHPDPVRSMQLSRILHARGIRGLVLMSLRMPSLRLQWEHFSSVAIGEYFSSPHLNHVRLHHSAVITSLYEELKKLGYRKIGFCNIKVSEERKHHLYLGAYLQCLYLDGISVSTSPPLLYDQDNWSPLPWLDHHGFDAVMSMVPQAFLDRLKGSRYRVPKNLGLAGYALPHDPGSFPFSGYLVDYRQIGAVAVQQLQAMLHTGRRGIPRDEEYFDVMVRGQWTPGKSTRKISRI